MYELLVRADRTLLPDQYWKVGRHMALVVVRRKLADPRLQPPLHGYRHLKCLLHAGYERLMPLLGLKVQQKKW